MTSQSSCWAVSDRVTRGGRDRFSGATALSGGGGGCEFALSILTVTSAVGEGERGDREIRIS